MEKKAIRMVTPIPGPKSAEWLKKKETCVADAFTVRVPTIIKRGRGALIEDIDGNIFIDLAGGVGVLNVGHAHPEIARVIAEQAELFLHTDFSVIPYQSFISLASRLTRLAPGTGAKKCVFFNSGAEAVENAVKIAKAYTHKKAIISFEGGFHGRTLMCMSLSSKAKPYKTEFGPFASDIYRIPYPYCYRCPLNLEHPSCGIACAELLERTFNLFVSPEETAAVIIEPVQGEGGYIVPPKEYLKRISQICSSHQVLLIIDEIQSGFGRTGEFFASTYFEVDPDLMTIGKSIAAGLPLSGVIGKKEMMDAPKDSTIGGTYPGNPVACAAGLKVLDIIEQEGLLCQAGNIGRRFYHRFCQMAEKYPLIGDVRGLGAMVGVEFVKDRKSKEPAGAETDTILKKAMQRGVIAIKCGLYGNVLRILCPLVIKEDECDEALEVLEEAIKEVDIV